MIRHGLRRLVIVVGLAVGLTGVVSLLLGLLTGAATLRSLSLGYMLFGSLVMIVGLGAGLRGWSPNSGDGADSGSERIAASGILIGIGAALVLLGIGLDPRTSLV